MIKRRMIKDWMMKDWIIKDCSVATCFCILAVSSALAQQIEATPVPPKITSEVSANKLKSKIVDPGNNSVIYPAPIYPAAYATYLSDSVTEQRQASGLTESVVAEIVPDPYSVVDKLPPTITVRTEVLLELHSMRNSAVDLCLQIPKKYRTRLPECADIFSHEIRLQELARKNK